MEIIRIRRLVSRAVVARIDALHYAFKVANGDQSTYNESRRQESTIKYGAYLEALEILTDVESDTWDETLRDVLGESPTDNRLHTYAYEICLRNGFVEEPQIHS